MSGTGGRLRRLFAGSTASQESSGSDRLDRARIYRPDLDGLRAIAIGLVMLTHTKWPWATNGGDAGVTAFFVLSGFLITNLLLGEFERRGSIDVIAFYRRRVIRLAPALLGLLAFTLVLGAAMDLHNHWQLGLLSCLAYVSNWDKVAGLNIHPLGHTCTLAIEEQFYLVWPALIVFFRGRIVVIALAAVVAGTAIRFVATGPFEYFSTITRADAIFLGCLLALTRVTMPGWAGWLALVALFGVAAMNLDHDPTIGTAMIAAAIIIAARVEWLGALAPIGRRAYSLYLWNWPMTVLFGSLGPIAPVVTILVAEVSYRLLEAPVMHRGRAQRVKAVLSGSSA